MGRRSGASFADRRTYSKKGQIGRDQLLLHHALARTTTILTRLLIHILHLSYTATP